MDGKLILLAPSMNLSVFMDGKQILLAQSMNLSVFMDGKLISCAPSMKMSVFMYGQSFPGQSGARQPPSEVPPRHIALLHCPKTADGANQSPSEAATVHIALLHSARRRREEVTGSQAVRRKQGRNKRKLRSFIVSVPKPPRLPPWLAGRRRCPCRRDGPGGSGVSRRNGRPGR